MKKLLLVLFLLVQAGAITRVKGQVDPHFSQYYAYPLWLNPALTGVIDGIFRVNLNYRDQWPGIGNGYRTAGLSAELSPTPNIGLGVNVINQSAGTAGYNYFAAYASFAYGIPVKEDQWLHFGLQGGFINRNVDFSKFQMGNQYDPVTGFNGNLPDNERFLYDGSMVFDGSAGIFYEDRTPEQVARLFAGVSAAHLARAKDPIVFDETDAYIPIRYTAHGGVRLALSESVDFVPHGIYMRQQHNTVRVAGAYAEFKAPNGNDLMVGAMYRINDSAVFNIGYRLRTLVMGVSYDFTTSDLHTANNRRGGPEFSLSYVFGKRNTDLPCPRF